MFLIYKLPILPVNKKPNRISTNCIIFREENGEWSFKIEIQDRKIIISTYEVVNCRVFPIHKLPIYPVKIKPIRVYTN